MLTVWIGAVGCVPAPADRAKSLVRQHREEEAIHVLEADLSRHPEDLEALRLLIRVRAAAGDFRGAQAGVEALERRLPEGDPSAWIELGHAYELDHHFEEALAAYDEASSSAPLSAAGPREGGMRCARWGEAGEARPRLEEAVRRGARDAETFHVLGLVLLKLGDLEAAREAYREGTKSDPKEAENWLGLATVSVAKGDAAGALAAYDAILERRPRFGPAALGRAWALAKMGRKDEARRALDHAVELGAPAANVARQRASLASP